MSVLGVGSLCYACGSPVRRCRDLLCNRCYLVLCRLPFPLSLIDKAAVTVDAKGRLLCCSLSGQWYRWQNGFWQKVG